MIDLIILAVLVVVMFYLSGAEIPYRLKRLRIMVPFVLFLFVLGMFIAG